MLSNFKEEIKQEAFDNTCKDQTENSCVHPISLNNIADDVNDLVLCQTINPSNDNPMDTLSNKNSVLPDRMQVSMSISCDPPDKSRTHSESLISNSQSSNDEDDSRNHDVHEKKVLGRCDFMNSSDDESSDIVTNSDSIIIPDRIDTSPKCSSGDIADESRTQTVYLVNNSQSTQEEDNDEFQSGDSSRCEPEDPLALGFASRRAEGLGQPRPQPVRELPPPSQPSQPGSRDKCGFRGKELHGHELKRGGQPENAAETHQCPVCGSIRDSARGLRLHMAFHKLIDSGAERPYECVTCSERFARKDTLEAHERTHVKTMRFACGTCGKRFSLWDALANHERIHAEAARPFACGTCSERFALADDLHAHEQAHAEARPFGCGTCEERFAVEDALEAHEQTHRPLDCATCGRHFTQRDALEAHERSHIDPEPFACGTCDERFAERDALEAHERIHIDPEPFACGTCDERFALKDALEDHEQIHDAEARPFACRRCDERYARADALEVHKWTHTEGKPFGCGTCDEYFAARDALEAHERTHIDAHCRTCGRYFAQRDALKAHERIHMDPLPFACGTCGERFALNVALRKHERIHSKYKPFACGTCGQRFALRLALRKHEQTHTEETVPPPEPREATDAPGELVCANCSATFSSATSLAMHQIQKHAEEEGIDVKPSIESLNFSSAALAAGSAPPKRRCDRPLLAEESRELRCDACNVQFPHVRSMSEHERQVHTGGPHMCKTCGAAFRIATGLQAHQDRVHRGSAAVEDGGSARSKTPPRRKRGRPPAERPAAEKRRSRSVVDDDDDLPAHTCRDCGASFGRAAELRSHKRGSDGARSHVCSTCSAIFQCSTALAQHEQTHDAKGQRVVVKTEPGEAEHSSESQTSAAAAGEQAQHMDAQERTDAKERPFACGICGMCFTQKTNLKKHEKTHISRPNNSLEAHERTHTNGRRVQTFDCGTCGKGFLKKTALNAHEKTHTDTKRFACGTCGERFSRKDILRTHEQRHTDKPFVCSTCGEGFQDQHILRTHRWVHRGEKPFVCATCGSAFRLEARLRFHERVHPAVSPFGCATCGATFSKEEDLKVHAQTHPAKPFVCGLCGVGFLSGSALVAHERSHERSQAGLTSVCEDCGAAFPEGDSLQQHQLRAHAAGRGFPCSTCDATFSNGSSLRFHQQLEHHLGGACHACAACGAAFSSAVSLRWHERRAHGSEQPLLEECGGAGGSGSAPLPEPRVGLCCATTSSAASLATHPPHELTEEVDVKPSRESLDCSSVAAAADGSTPPPQRQPVQPPIPEEWHRCAPCDVQFPSGGSLLAHEKLVHSGGQHGCRICGAAFKLASGLREHADRTHGDHVAAVGDDSAVDDGYGDFQPAHACRDCGASFGRASELCSHKRGPDGVRIHMCTTCGDIFQCSTALAWHERTHDAKGERVVVKTEPGEAEYSSESQTSAAVAVEHSQQVEKRRSRSVVDDDDDLPAHTCRDCGASFGRAAELRSHKRGSDGARSHVCSTCKAIFQCSTALARHEQTHDAEGQRVVVKAEPGEAEPGEAEHSTKSQHRAAGAGKDPQQGDAAKAKAKQNQSVHCPICHRGYGDAIAMRWHMHRKHAGKSLRDSSITAATKRARVSSSPEPVADGASHKASHKASHHEQGLPHACRKCGTEFRSFLVFRMHEESCRGVGSKASRASKGGSPAKAGP